jgi:hypothetical protein
MKRECLSDIYVKHVVRIYDVSLSRTPTSYSEIRNRLRTLKSQQVMVIGPRTMLPIFVDTQRTQRIRTHPSDMRNKVLLDHGQ